MKIVRKFIAILFCFIGLFSISSCNYNYYDVDEIKKTFSQYPADESIFIQSWGDLSFFNESINLKEFISDEESVQTVGIYEEKICFLSSIEKYFKKPIIKIYSCNKDGTDLKELYKKELPALPLETVLLKGVFYIEYRINYVTCIADSYNLVTGEYKISEAKKEGYESSVLDDYKKDSGYSLKWKKKQLSITEKTSGKEIRIDTQSIKNTVCYQNMQKYNYYLDGVKFCNGEIYVSYLFAVGMNAGLEKYLTFLFSLDFETETYEYKTCIFAESIDTFHYNIMKW